MVKKEFSPIHQQQTEQKLAVLMNTLLLNGDAAAPFILSRATLFPTKRIVIIGEPGANKTTLLLQIGSALADQDPTIRPQYVFYDDAAATVKNDLGISRLATKDHHRAVSQTLSKTVEDTFPTTTNPDGTRTIQCIELPGVSLRDRGVSTLRRIAERTADQQPLERDTIIIGIAADTRSLNDAGVVRNEVLNLGNPLDVYPTLLRHNIFITGLPKETLSLTNAQAIIEFFNRMAPGVKIKEVHNEVMTQARRRTTKDDLSLFRQLRLPHLRYPIKDRRIRSEYLLNASFMHAYLAELGLISNKFEPIIDPINDSGIPIFSPYNPAIPKVLNLEKVLTSLSI